MKGINQIRAEELRDWDSTTEINGRWRMARPEGFHGGLLFRLRMAWKVFTGKADVLYWFDQ